MEASFPVLSIADQFRSGATMPEQMALRSASIDLNAARRAFMEVSRRFVSCPSASGYNRLDASARDLQRATYLHGEARSALYSALSHREGMESGIASDLASALSVLCLATV